MPLVVKPVAAWETVPQAILVIALIAWKEPRILLECLLRWCLRQHSWLHWFYGKRANKLWRRSILLQLALWVMGLVLVEMNIPSEAK